MRVLIQRVKKAKVSVGSEQIGSIDKGLLLLVGIGSEDTDDDVGYIVNKITALRIFDDSNKRMNLNIMQINGEILSVPQFTLYADTLKGNRPGFDKAAAPERAKEMWKNFNRSLANKGIPVKAGQFAANMEVALINDGPVTIWMDSK